MYKCFLIATICFSIGMAQGASAQSIEKQINWDGQVFTISANHLVEADQSALEEWEVSKIVFKEIRVEMDGMQDLYLSPAELRANYAGGNSDKNLLTRLCRSMTDGEYDHFATTFRTEEEDLTMTEVLPFYRLWGAKILAFTNTLNCKGAWPIEVDNHKSNSRHIENLICIRTDKSDIMAEDSLLYDQHCQK